MTLVVDRVSIGATARCYYQYLLQTVAHVLQCHILTRLSLYQQSWQFVALWQRYGIVVDHWIEDKTHAV